MFASNYYPTVESISLGSHLGILELGSHNGASRCQLFSFKGQTCSRKKRIQSVEDKISEDRNHYKNEKCFCAVRK